MKSFVFLSALVSLALATSLGYNSAYKGQVLMTEQSTFPGFNLDLSARRLVEFEGQEPIWMTELQKVAQIISFPINCLSC